VFAQLKTITLDAYDRIVGLVLEESSSTAASPRLPAAASALDPRRSIDARKSFESRTATSAAKATSTRSPLVPLL
jgi:hypothetical protein